MNMLNRLMTSNTDKKNSFGDTAVLLWEQKQQVIIVSFAPACGAKWDRQIKCSKMFKNKKIFNQMI